MMWMEKVIVVISVEQFDLMRTILKTHNHSDKVVLVPGEMTRHGSIHNAIKYINSGHGQSLLSFFMVRTIAGYGESKNCYKRF